MNYMLNYELCVICVHSYSLMFYLCSLVFTRALVVFTFFHLCFTYVHSPSPSSLLTFTRLVSDARYFSIDQYLHTK